MLVLHSPLAAAVGRDVAGSSDGGEVCRVTGDGAEPGVALAVTGAAL